MKRKFDLSLVIKAHKDRVGVLGLGLAGESTGEGMKQRKELYSHLDPVTKSLSRSMMAIYSAPQFSMLPVITLLGVYAFTFYESLGGSTSVATFFVALARCLDVLLTPYMSILSDHCKSKYGRRLPFCFIGCWLYIFFLLMVCTPPTSLNPEQLTGWFGVSYVGFFLSYTFLSIPYDALGPELTDNYDDRSLLYFTSGMFELLGSIIGIVLPGFLAITVNLDVLTFTCSNKSCFNSNGYGQSCMTDPRTQEIKSFYLFDASKDFSTTSCSEFRNIKNLTTAEVFIEDNCILQSQDEKLSACMTNYCSCIANCDNLCTNDSRRLAFRWVAGIFSLWILASMLLMLHKIKERKKSILQENTLPAPIFPSILSLFRNRAFTTLLPAWVLESTAFTLIASMMVYYVRYVIKPEFQSDCNKGTPIKGQLSDSWQCKSNLIVGAVITAMLLSAFVACPIWLLLVNKYGKRDVWLGWSASYAFCMILFFSVGEGDVVLAVVLSFIAGIPLGAKFISDAILADIIEYDEFLTGSRNEATFTMFKSFIPKLCAIPAGSLPIAILNAIGHVQPVSGNIQQQPSNIAGYCITMTIVIPTILCLLALVVKTRYPFKTRASVESLQEGIGKQLEGRSSKDPISRLEYISPRYTNEEQILVHKIDHFPSVLDAECLKACLINDRLDVTFDMLFARVREHLAITFFVMFGCSIGTILSYPLIQSANMFIVPTFCVIFLGLSILIFTFQMYRFYAVRDIKFHTKTMTKELLAKVISYRRRVALINGIQAFRVFRVVNSNEPFLDVFAKRIRRMYRSYQRWSAKFFHGIEEENDDDEEDDDNEADNIVTTRDANDLDSDDDIDEDKEVKVEKEEEVIEMGIFSHSHKKKVDVQAERVELYRRSYETWFEINNLGCFAEMPMFSEKTKPLGMEMSVWDHELYSFLIEMGKINAYFQKLRIKKMQNRGVLSSTSGHVQGGGGGRGGSASTSASGRGKAKKGKQNQDNDNFSDEEDELDD